MDTFFIETIQGDLYRIALVDRHRIFNAINPGELSSIFECSISNPTREDDAQIFYALAAMIKADDLIIDLIESHRTHKLNFWSISIKDKNINNIFEALEPLSRSDRLKLYGTKHSITPELETTCESKSLFSLVALAESQKWKTGILQECIDRLVKLEFRHNPLVYSIIDEQYRRILRFKLETEAIDICDQERIFVLFVRRLMSELGLQNTHDSTIFTTISPMAEKVLISLIKLLPAFPRGGSAKEKLSKFLTSWSGSKIIDVDEGFKIQVENDVIEGLKYMQTWFSRPNFNKILHISL